MRVFCLCTAIVLTLLTYEVNAKPASAQEHKGADEPALMSGFPPPPEQLVTRANFMLPPYNRWAFQHMRELQPTREVARGNGPISPLDSFTLDLDQISVTASDKRELGLEQFLETSYTDSFLILHGGKVIYERYMNNMVPERQHQMFSATKSFVGVLVLMFIENGAISSDQLVSHYLPELAGSAFGDATVQQVLDMTTGISFSEIYDDPDSEIWRYGYVFNVFPRPEQGYTGPVVIYDYLPTLNKQGAHGEWFHYVTPNTDVLAWIISRISGKSLAQLLEFYLWEPMGVEQTAYIWLDDSGTEMAGGGLNVTARDAARFGQMILQGGKLNNRQIISSAIAETILSPGDPAGFTRHYGDDPWYGQVASAYRNQWWTFNNPHKAVSAIGVHGQYIYIDKKAGMVVVKQSSAPDAEGGANLINDVEGPLLYQAIAEHLMKHNTVHD
ncbi:MAG: serine hydrolase [Halieaceae bacterium]